MTDNDWKLAERHEAMREDCPKTIAKQFNDGFIWADCAKCEARGWSPNITTDALIHILLSEGYVVEYGTDFHQLGTKGYWIQFTHDNSDAPTFYGETHQEALIEAVLFDMAVEDEMEAKTNA